MSWYHALIAVSGMIALAAAAGYGLLTAVGLLVWRGRSRSVAPGPLPPVTLLKPLCGAEPGLYEHLRSFCTQDYPEYQIVAGVRDPQDPALAAIRRLAAEFPSRSIAVVVNPQLHGHNLKISNLINMVAHARHDLLVLADSDTWVGPDYLATVTAPLRDAKVGLVTCLYRDVPTAGVWSRLGAMYINEWYMPAVLLAWLLGLRSYVSGQTLCITRQTLQAIGGFKSIVNHLADDHRLGELVRQLGLRIVISAYEVMAQHDEPTWSALTRHEVRWMGTIRVLQPGSFRLLFLSFSLPLAVLGLMLAVAGHAAGSVAWSLFGIAVAVRLLLHVARRPSAGARRIGDLWLIPARDLLLCWVWCQCFFTARLTWRDSVFDVDADGIMHKVS